MNILPKPKKMVFDERTTCTNRECVYWFPDESLPQEGYRIQLLPDKIEIRYRDEHGRRYAALTLDALRRSNHSACGTLEDYPSYAHRGVHLDVARYYISIKEIKEFIDVLSLLKFNVLHLHLNDEQGWRIHISAYPLLTQIGANRPYSDYGRTKDMQPHGGWYTKDEVCDLVAYAKERAIDIMPEIEMPGHCSAILAAYPSLSCKEEPVHVKTRGGVYDEILCAGNEEVYRMLETIIDECCEIFPYPFFHIGADEAKKDHWRSCPRCQAKMREEGIASVAGLQDYFVQRMASYIRSKGKRTIIYSDGLRANHTCSDVDVQYWVGDKEQTQKLLQGGSKVIVSTHGMYYFDLGYGQTSLKKAYEYDPAQEFAPYEEQVCGVEGMLWGEFIPDQKTRYQQAFPRLLALSETAWNANEKEAYASFAKRCSDFIQSNHLHAAPEALWNMPKGKRILDMLRFYHRTMTWQDLKQFVSVLRNEKKEKEENEKITGN